MSPNKRKIIVSDESDEDDSFKHRRSSLHVNLSYTGTELTDSGNGSLWKTEITNDEREKNKRQQSNARLSRRKNIIHGGNNRQSDFENELQASGKANRPAASNGGDILCTKEGIRLKRLTINLEDISIREKTLETNCKRLKDIILSKTKEMFDKENELSLKTTMVLGNEKNHCASSTRGLKDNAENKSVIMLDTTDNLKNKTTRTTTAIKCKQHIANDQRQCNEKEHFDIISTPTSSGKQSSKRTLDKSGLSQRRLFAEEGKEKCRIIEDIVLEKKFPLLSLGRAEPGSSPILSSSNQRLSLKRLSKLRLQSQFENNNTLRSIVQCDQSINIGAPIVCSTFIEQNVTDGRRDETACEADGDRDISRITHTMNKTVSMELTEINGGIRTSQDMPPSNRNPSTSSYNRDDIEKNPKEDKNVTVQRLGRNDNNFDAQNNGAHSQSPTVNVVNAQDVESVCIDTRVTEQPSIEEIRTDKNSRDTIETDKRNSHTKNKSGKHRASSPSDSNNTIRSSLNMNTSVDVAAVARDQECATVINRERIILKNRETMDSIQTSLQMNTSADSIRRTWRGKSNYFSGQSSVIQEGNADESMGNHSSVHNRCSSASKNREQNVDLLENMSLIERLRNISTRNQVSIQADIPEFNNVMNAKCRNSERVSTSGDSYVEGTPYPISRSVLLKSHLKHKTHNLGTSASCSNNNINSGISEEDVEQTKLDASYPKVGPVSNETTRTNGADTVILEDTPSSNFFVTRDTLIIIKDTPDEAASKTEEKIITPQHAECISSKTSKKKLLSLHENSQLYSFTPLEEGKCTSESSASEKQNNKLRKKRPKKKPADFKTKKNVRHKEKEQTWSDSDYDTFEMKRKEEKRTKKPKKIVSKKIVIKKFAEENVLNILMGNERDKRDQTLENRDSLNDFTKHRTIPAQWKKHKSQKIVIATTGLSKENKHLVRNIVRSLGAAQMELNVSRRTTHVISTGVRTVNLLRGIIRGCWLVTLEWVLKSLENNAWLDPEEFEMKHFSKAVQENRKDRQLFGPSYIPELFSTCGFIYVEQKTAVPCDTLKELVKTAGGHITEDAKFAKIIVGRNGLRETWVIDSITTGELQLTKLYGRK